MIIVINIVRTAERKFYARSDIYMQDGLRNVHSSMIQRCENPKRQQYSRYGGRGIKVCEEWHNYEIFRKWALEK